ncbi:hypothetical protein MWN34_12550 [Ancylobacter sp. 6x-1]|uniref:WYL domain-containing protein n=1 Tax=Ancylobacter crimeensis TaxID=2579147 RepID=A0ABT0DCP9_9HYPH|nr:hypothetical protein [Ancylobacter crimeensis]MCK0197742.1 hypothetical protein [Ancylobacter crimeensis]
MVNWNREYAAYRWSEMAPAEQARIFRDGALKHVRNRHARLRQIGLHVGDDDEPRPYHVEAIDRLVDLALVQRRDDDEACEAVQRMLCAVDGECRGIIPDEFLYLRAGGPRVRARMLKEGFIAGRSVGALYVNAVSKVVLREYFKEAGHSLLMDDDELATMADLRKAGPTVRLYRGSGQQAEVNSARRRGMSWTRNRATAERFANGKAWGGRWAAVLECDYPVKHILALWETSGYEPEVVIDPTRARDIVAELRAYVEPAKRSAPSVDQTAYA